MVLNRSWQKRQSGFLLVLVLVCLLLCAARAVYGDAATFERQAAYQAGRADNKSVCRILALEQAKKLLFRALVSYLDDNQEIKRFQLTEEQLAVYGVGLVTPEIVQERWDGTIYYFKLKLTADPVEISKALALLHTEPDRTKDLEWLKKKREELLRNIGRSSRNFESMKTATKKVDPKVYAAKVEEYRDTINKLGSLDWFEKGFVLQQKGNSPEAVKAYSRAIEIVPGFIRALFNRGTLYGLLGSHKQAVKDFDTVIDLTPDAADAHFARGVAYHRLGNYRMACRDFSKDIELNQGHAEAYVIRGLAYHRLGDYRSAVKDFSRVIELNPQYAEAYAMRGAAYFGLDDYQQAVENHTKAIELKPAYPEAYFNRGTAYYRLNSFEEAIKDFDKAITLNPQYAEAYAIRGATYGSMGNYQKADEDLKTGARLGDKDARVFLKAKGMGWEEAEKAK